MMIKIMKRMILDKKTNEKLYVLLLKYLKYNIYVFNILKLQSF